MHWYIDVLKKYAVFEGRARRKEYWMFALVSALVLIFLSLIDEMTGWKVWDDEGVLSLLYSIAVFVPTFAVLVRRLHDTDRSGWWCLILLIPLIGLIVVFVFLVSKGNEGDNRFGPDPKAETARW
ncbi:MAG: DUF805 domain-containing protein [Gemmatimonadetes bacterium]|nr:DUF805 domain-containing protein [Gemmatimonadota bacterium]